METNETITQWLLRHIELFMDLNDMEPDGNSFGWKACQDRTLVTRLRDGGDIRTTLLLQILSFMQNPISQSGKPLTLKPINIQRRILP